MGPCITDKVIQNLTGKEQNSDFCWCYDMLYIENPKTPPKTVGIKRHIQQSSGYKINRQKSFCISTTINKLSEEKLRKQ